MVFATSCEINGKLKIYNCYSNFKTAMKHLNKLKSQLKANYKFWARSGNICKEYERRAKEIKAEFDNLTIVKLVTLKLDK